MLDYDQLTSMRETLDSSLPELGWILRETTADDGAGGISVITERTTTKAIPFRIGPVPVQRTAIYPIAEGSISEPMFTLTFSQDTDIVIGDSVESESGRFFLVVSKLAARSYQLSTRVICKEVS